MGGVCVGSALVVHGAPDVWWNGLNVPWDSFGYDIGTSVGYNTTWFGQFYDACEANHINSARFWVHCDGRASPYFDSSGYVTGLSSTFLSDLQHAIQQAEKTQTVLLITLFSFDMCNQEVSTGLHVDLIQDESKTQSYVQQALIPILRNVSGYQNVVWEVINEPEWCIQETPSTTSYSVPLNDMQRFVSLIANAIHAYSPHKVTVGSASLKWNSDVSPAVGNWWKDAALQQGASLDFYQVHYYDWMHEWGYDPAQNSVEYWQMDKPCLVGEAPATGGSYYSPTDFMQLSYDNNYVGVMYWSYNADYPWTDAINAYNAMYQNYTYEVSYSQLLQWISTV